MSDDFAHEIVAKIADMAEQRDPHDPNIQWNEGYSQACNDIVLMICRAARKRRSITEVLPEAQKTL